ncbi:MAG: hypothetical protein AB8B69_26365, partial [Chitinophagales bacterium]
LNQKETKAVQILQKLLLIDAKEQIRTEADFDNIRSSDGFKEVLAVLDSLQIPIIQSDTAFVISQKTLHPESIAYDPLTESFYLSSFHLRKIVRINEDGTIEDFVREAQNGLWAVSGIKIDTSRRWLWATSVAAPQMVNFEEKEEGYTGIFKYDLDSGELLGKYLLQEEEAHWLGDFVLHPNGDVYATDSKQAFIYYKKMKSDSLEKYVSHPNFVSLQGITLDIPASSLFVADYRNGIFKIDLESRQILQMIPPKEVSLKGIDGLYFYHNSLITIQNGVNPMRVMRHKMDENQLTFYHSQILDHNHPAFDEPTLGVIVEGTLFYVANSPWTKYRKDGTMFSVEKLSDVIILKTKLK